MQEPYTGIPVVSRHNVVPQSPQKVDVITWPESAFLLKRFGVPDSSVKALLSTKRLVLNMLPLTFLQSVQWQSACGTKTS